MTQSVSQIWASLEHRNFRLFFWGQGASIIGTWMTRMATNWLVFRLTDSALLLGIVTFASTIVPFFLQPFAGVWAEKHDRQKILIYTQTAASLQALVLAILTLARIINVWEIIFLSFIQGLIMAFDTPCRHSFLVQMIDEKSDLANAIALNSTIVNLGRLIGPALAGLTISLVGEGGCFLIDSISYLAVICSLNLMKIKPIKIENKINNIWLEVLEGWSFVNSDVLIRNILFFFAIMSLIGYPYMVLLPVFVSNVFHLGPSALGWLTASSGFGSLVSALYLTINKSQDSLIKIIQKSSLLLGMSLVLFGLSHQFVFSLLVIAFAGFGLMMIASASNMVVQIIVPEDMRARVISYYAMAFFGAVPIGSLIAGVLAQKFGASYTVVISGVMSIVASIWFYYQTINLNKANIKKEINNEIRTVKVGSVNA